MPRLSSRKEPSVSLVLPLLGEKSMAYTEIRTVPYRMTKRRVPRCMRYIQLTNPAKQQYEHLQFDL